MLTELKPKFKGSATTLKPTASASILDDFAVSNNNEFDETPATAAIRKVSNANGAGGASLVKRAVQEANHQQVKKVITLDRSAASQPESSSSSGVRDIESRLKKRSAEHEGRDLESMIREKKKDHQ
jgi:hypothetical protein